MILGLTLAGCSVVIGNLQNTGKVRAGAIGGCLVTAAFYCFKVRIHISPGPLRKCTC